MREEKRAWQENKQREFDDEIRNRDDTIQALGRRVMQLLQRDREPEGDAGDSGDDQHEAGENENIDPQNLRVSSVSDSDDDVK